MAFIPRDLAPHGELLARSDHNCLYGDDFTWSRLLHALLAVTVKFIATAVFSTGLSSACCHPRGGEPIVGTLFSTSRATYG